MEPLPLVERMNRWIQESIMVKLLSIGLLIIILLIPSAWITGLIYEREQRAGRVTEEIAEKWASAQTVTGPIIVIPFRVRSIVEKSGGEKEITERVEKAFFLPAELNITGTVTPQRLHRGIFDAVVYNSNLTFNTTFSRPDFTSLDIDESMVNWSDAYVVFGISDLRGISEEPMITVGDAPLTTEPSNNIGLKVQRVFRDDAERPYPRPPMPATFAKGIVAALGWTDVDSFSEEMDVTLNLKGSKRLDFIPSGKTTTVTLSSPWSTPSFDGEFLPASREVNDDGFSATWQILHFNRPLPQQWTGTNREISGADFGVKLLLPVDQYQRSIRTAKYGVMIILLTFMALFLVEITRNVRIHPFQYILIGAALIIYYCLLLSFSEQLGYNTAYLIASTATVGLITLYSRTFFANAKLSLLLGLLLIVFYTFIYVIILQEDLSLLIGSVGLFLIIAALMYFSRNVRYYQDAPAARQR